MDVEVCVGGERCTAGSARDCVEKQKDMRSALRTLEEFAAAGMLSLAGRAVWHFEVQFPSVADWKEFVEKPTCGGIDADRKQLDVALSRTDGRVVIIEENFALVYARSASDSTDHGSAGLDPTPQP
jgi:hypothetical protein